jgi:signal transduction histidine kinase
LVLREEVIGLLAVSSITPGAFGEHHVNMLRAVATQAAIAIGNARMLAEAEERARETQALLQVSYNLASTLELEPLLDVVLEQMKAVADYDGASIIVREGDHLSTLRRRAAARAGTVPGPPAAVPIERAESWWPSITRSRAVIVGDMHGDEPLAHAYRAMVGVPWEQSRMHYVRSWMAIPLALQDRVIGAVVLAHGDPHVYTQRHADLAAAIATQAAAAIENARLLAESERRARELAALLEVSQRVNSTLALEPLLDLILEQLRRVIDYRGATIGIIEGDELLVAGSRAVTPEREADRGMRVKLAGSGPIAASILGRQPVIIADIWGDSPEAAGYRAVNSGWMDRATHRDIRSWMAVPLVVKDAVIGHLTASQDVPDYFTARHAELAFAFANQAAIAIENARLYAQTEQRTRELSTLLEVSDSLSSTLALKPLLGLILDQLKVVADYTSSSILTVDGEEVVQRDFRWPGTPASQVPEQRDPIERIAPIWEYIRRREPLVVPDVRGDSRAARAYRQVVGDRLETSLSYVRSWMAVPMALKDRVIGLITLAKDEPDFYTPGHVELATAIASQAAIAIENARLYEAAASLAALEERQRLARELHDSVSQALFGIALGARTARRRLDQEPARVGEALDYVLSLADAGLTEMRALIFELRPESLEKDGLVVALTRQAAATRARHEIAVETDLCDEPNAPLPIKEALYRIAQEAMHNAVKHAQATRLDLVLARSTDGLTLEVRDDGAGFNPDQDFAGHLGLRSMRERAALVGGTVEVTSASGAGTLIRANAPLEAAGG